MILDRRSFAGVRGRHRAPLRLAARSLARYGQVLGWGLLGLGMLGALRVAIRLGTAAPQGPGTTGQAFAPCVEAATWILGMGLLGWGAALACRLIVALVLRRDARVAMESRRRNALNERAAAALERAAAALEGAAAVWETSGARSFGPSGGEVGRVESLASIDRAIGEKRWSDAGPLVAAFIEERPDDPAGPERRERLEAGRRASAQDRLAELAAARQVNDPTRALELFSEIAPLLEAGPRGELERELASWFLDVIQRRLRGVAIQPELVELASRVAETFRATVAGASLRAALPTLRRSVGLCPRCARPYRGTADACAECLSGVADAEAEG